MGRREKHWQGGRPRMAESSRQSGSPLQVLASPAKESRPQLPALTWRDRHGRDRHRRNHRTWLPPCPVAKPAGADPLATAPGPAPAGLVPGLGIFLPRWTLADDRSALTQQIKEANDIVDVVGSYVS